MSLDTLLTVNLVECTPTEQYLISFIDKLKNDTERDELAWNKEVAQDLNSVPVDENGIPNHPYSSLRKNPLMTVLISMCLMSLISRLIRMGKIPSLAGIALT